MNRWAPRGKKESADAIVARARVHAYYTCTDVYGRVRACVRACVSRLLHACRRLSAGRWLLDEPSLIPLSTGLATHTRVPAARVYARSTQPVSRRANVYATVSRALGPETDGGALSIASPSSDR